MKANTTMALTDAGASPAETAALIRSEAEPKILDSLVPH